MADLVVRNALLRGADKTVDIVIEQGRIAALEPKFGGQASAEVDAAGGLVLPSFTDPHIHLDKVLISEVVRDNVSGTLEEAIAIIWEKKKRYTLDGIMERAGRTVQWAVLNGTTRLCSHVDVDTIGGLMPLKGVLAAREKCKDIADIKIVAFPQEGIVQDEGCEELMWKAMEMGADIVGGMPFNEMTSDDSKKHLDICFEIAKEHDASLDMHVDETDNPNARTLEEYATRAIKNGFVGRVTAGHTCALSAYDDHHAAKVIGLVKRAKMNMITNPATNLMLQGRLDTGNIRRGLTRVKELLAAGVNVAYGQDCIKDTFYPTFGQCDLLEVGLLCAHAVQLSMPKEIETLMDMPTVNASRMFGVADYGIAAGNTADLVVLAEKSPQEAFRTHLPRPAVIKGGRIVARSSITQELVRG